MTAIAQEGTSVEKPMKIQTMVWPTSTTCSTLWCACSSRWPWKGGVTFRGWCKSSTASISAGVTSCPWFSWELSSCWTWPWPSLTRSSLKRTKTSRRRTRPTSTWKRTGTTTTTSTTLTSTKKKCPFSSSSQPGSTPKRWSSSSESGRKRNERLCSCSRRKKKLKWPKMPRWGGRCLIKSLKPCAWTAKTDSTESTAGMEYCRWRTTWLRRPWERTRWMRWVNTTNSTETSRSSSTRVRSKWFRKSTSA